MTPQRIQLRRSKGWRKPADAIVVSRPTRWGNPFGIVREYGDTWAVKVSDGTLIQQMRGRDAALATAIELYRGLMLGWSPRALLSYANLDAAYFAHRAWLNRRGRQNPVDAARIELAGHDLACWCPLEDADGNRVPCHADVLLELANPGWQP